LIDRTARDQLADALRALASGLVSNDEFEDSRLPHSRNDAVIREVFSRGAWMLYSDTHEYRLAGKNKLDALTKSEVARWVLFLKTDLRYEWPVYSMLQTLGMLLANVLTLGMANRIFIPRFATHGDVDVWPFIRKADYEAALQNPPYLR